MNEDKLDFNTYCIFAEEKQGIKETIGLIFRDYIEKMITDRRPNARIKSQKL